VVLLAHAGHWLIWVLYAVPVLIVVVSIVASVVRQRRERRGGPELSEQLGEAGFERSPELLADPALRDPLDERGEEALDHEAGGELAR
jgi:cytochrome c-type biogenesis protein CcmH/NrfF